MPRWRRWAAADGIVVCALAVTHTARAQASQQYDAAGGLATLIETVTDHTTRVPLSGALVTASWRDDGERRVRVRTDSIGRTKTGRAVSARA